MNPKGFTHFAPDPMRFDKPQKNEIHSLNEYCNIKLRGTDITKDFIIFIITGCWSAIHEQSD